MIFHAFLIKYAEIAIKGKNRYLFEDALVKQMKLALEPVEGEFTVTKEQGRVYVFCPEKYDFEDIQNLGDIISGNKSRLDEKTKHKSVKVALELQGTNLFDALVSKFPNAQLRVLEALEEIREETKNNSSSNINYRKFIRDC